MDLNFYSDLTDGAGQPGDPEFLDPQAFNGFDTVQKVNIWSFKGGFHRVLKISA